MIPKKWIFEYKKHKYTINLSHKVNNIMGYTATGKTALIDLFEEMFSNRYLVPSKSNIDYDIIKTNISFQDLKYYSDNKLEYLVILDETSNLLKSLLKDKKISRNNLYGEKQIRLLLEKSKCVFVFITRNTRSCYPLPQDAVLQLENDSTGFNHSTKPICNIQKLKYNSQSEDIICEDSGSGYDFIATYIKNDNQTLISSNGVESIPFMLQSYSNSSTVFFDYLGAGHIVEYLLNIFENFDNIYNWYSLEYYILEKLGYKKDADLIVDSNQIYNKEKTLESFLKQKIIYNKKDFHSTSSCIAIQDCVGKTTCPHNSDKCISKTVVNCPLGTQQKRESIFKLNTITTTTKGKTNCFGSL